MVPIPHRHGGAQVKKEIISQCALDARCLHKVKKYINFRYERSLAGNFSNHFFFLSRRDRDLGRGLGPQAKQAAQGLWDRVRARGAAGGAERRDGSNLNAVRIQ